MLSTCCEFNNVRAREFNLATGRSSLNVAKRSKSIPYIICAYSWTRTNALSYPYERFLCLSRPLNCISDIRYHYSEPFMVSCSVYATNLYRHIVSSRGLEPLAQALKVLCATNCATKSYQILNSINDILPQI